MFARFFYITLSYLLVFIFPLISADHPFGYIEYSTFNIGDDIQSIAARRFLPSDAVPVNRELLGSFQGNEVIDTIVNGWYMYTSNTGWPWPMTTLSPPKKSWPRSALINPLLISLHFSKPFLSELFSKEGIDYLKTYGPVGARDYSTLSELQKRGVPSYFSGCLTLTLENEEFERDNIIYAVDIDAELVNVIKSRTNYKVECISHIMSLEMSQNIEKRFLLATDLLKKYKRAHCVVTSRLHAALPCLAFETPVLLINTQPDQERFEGLKELVHNCSRSEFMSNSDLFHFNQPPSNPNDYLPLKENLIQSVAQWVEQCQQKKWLTKELIFTPSIHVLIATTGRNSLLQMLKSLHGQLKESDYLTVVFDNIDKDNVFMKVHNYLKKFKCRCSLIMEPENLGFWGHGIRNKHNQLLGDFIMHADDDDLYTSDAIESVRRYCINKNTLYIFKMQCVDGSILWRDHELKRGEIGTPMGVIPSPYNSQSVWRTSYGGDFDFYNGLEKNGVPVEFIDQVIYLIRPEK